MNLCMAATYDPDPRAPLGFRVPFNLETGELIEARWRELARARPDPSRRPVPRATCKSLRGHLHRLRLARPVPHPLRHAHPVAARSPRQASSTRYEEFDDNHSDVDYRMDVSLPFLYRALKP